MIQPNKINIWIAPPAEGKTYKSVQYCIEQQQQHNTKFIFATCYHYQIVNMKQYIRRLFGNIDCLSVTETTAVLTGAVPTINSNVIFDDVNKNMLNLIALNNILAKHILNTVIITVNPHTFRAGDLKKCIDNLISHYGEDAINIIGDKIYYK